MGDSISAVLSNAQNRPCSFFIFFGWVPIRFFVQQIALLF